MEGEGEETEERGEKVLAGRAREGGRERRMEGQREGLRDTYTQTHRERDRQREREGREEACLPDGHRERMQFTISGRQQGWDVQDLGWCRKEIHLLPMFTQSSWGDRAVNNSHSECGQCYCRREHGCCRGLERDGPTVGGAKEMKVLVEHEVVHKGWWT